MGIKQEFTALWVRWQPLTLYEKFEQAVILILTALIAIVTTLAVWNLVVKLVLSVVSVGGLDPTDYGVFQALFGMMFTVIIALEFKRSLVAITGRRYHIIEARTVILIALLAIVRKFLILDLTSTDASQLFALAAAVLALGAVYWMVRDQDRRERAS